MKEKLINVGIGAVATVTTGIILYEYKRWRDKSLPKHDKH